MLTRRSLITRGALAAPLSLAVPALFDRAIALAADDGATPAGVSNSGRTLIIVQLAGGNDGLNTVVPYADGRYQDLRPTIGVDPSTVIPLDSGLGLHPELSGLKGLWDRGDLAVVENVGYDTPNLSHFQSMHIWETAQLQPRTFTGWMAPLAASDDNPLGVLSLGASLAPALCCPLPPPVTVNRLDGFALQPDPRDKAGADDRLHALQSLYQTYQAPAPYAALLDATAERAQDSARSLHSIADSYQPAATYPNTPLGQGLKLLAALIAGDAGLRIGYTVHGGFDTHFAQSQRQAPLLRQFGDAVAAFWQDVTAQGKGQDVLLMTWSEFGRRAQENASNGTDHGTAAPLFVLGGGVQRGIYGDPPDLGNLDENGNLRYSVDFRSVYATVLAGWLNADPTAVLGDSFPTLPLLAG